MTPLLSVLLGLSLPAAALCLLTPLLHRPPFAAILARLFLLPSSSFFLLNGSGDAAPFRRSLTRLVQLDYAFPGLFPALGFAILAAWLTGAAVGAAGPTFLQRGFKGRDLLKPNRARDHFIPETMGLPAACISILLLYLFIPFRYVSPSTFSSGLGGAAASTRAFLYTGSSAWEGAGLPRPSALLSPRQLAENLGVGIKSVASLAASHPAAQHSADGGWSGNLAGRADLPHHELAAFLSACLSLSSATMLGFLDDVFDIRWRYKLPIPLVSSVPLLVVYYTGGGGTHVVVPGFLKAIIGGGLIDLGPLYYLYISLLSTFCTNSINILAGINGVEVGQSLVIALSLVCNDLLYLDERAGEGGSRSSVELVGRHLFSLSLLIPFVGTCIGLLYWNRYPSRVFIGDTFCYFAGQMLAVAGVLGHFSKTLLLFFIPQIFNFLLSCPQLFGLVYCPRHRVPHVDAETMNVHPSLAIFAAKASKPSAKPRSTGFKASLTSTILRLFELLHFVVLIRAPASSAAEKNGSENGHDASRHHDSPETRVIASTNLTVLNAILVLRGVRPRLDLVRADELRVLARELGLVVEGKRRSGASEAVETEPLSADEEAALRSKLHTLSYTGAHFAPPLLIDNNNNNSSSKADSGRRAKERTSMTELGLWWHVMGVQALGSALAFSVRYWLAPVVFPQF
ncbi:tunicamycin resistance protein [Tilletia horrida]|nr:tunicamycin resistance protein [Tilletia horrida]